MGGPRPPKNLEETDPIPAFSLQSFQISKARCPPFQATRMPQVSLDTQRFGMCQSRHSWKLSDVFRVRYEF